MILVELTRKWDGNPVVVNMDCVKYFSFDGSGSDGTILYFEGSKEINVTESYEKVLSLAEDCPSTPADRLPKLKQKADACGIEFVCSTFSPVDGLV